MSTSYDLYCVDCQSWMGWRNDTDHMYKEMLVLRNDVQKIAVMADLIETMQSDMEIRPSWTTLILPLDWFKVHGSHTVEVITEYGTLLDECYSVVECHGCNNQHRCYLKKGHEGPCSPKPRAKKS